MSYNSQIALLILLIVNLKAHVEYLKKYILWMKTIHYLNKIDLTWSQSYQLHRLLQNQLQS